MTSHLKNIQNIVLPPMSQTGSAFLSGTISNTAGIFPFTLENDESLLALNSINLPSLVSLLPSYEITSELINLPNFFDYDIDENLIGHINSQYCAIEECGSLEASDKDFSLLHMNVLVDHVNGGVKVVLVVAH